MLRKLNATCMLRTIIKLLLVDLNAGCMSDMLFIEKELTHANTLMRTTTKDLILNRFLLENTWKNLNKAESNTQPNDKPHDTKLCYWRWSQPIDSMGRFTSAIDCRYLCGLWSSVLPETSPENWPRTGPENEAKPCKILTLDPESGMETYSAVRC